MGQYEHTINTESYNIKSQGISVYKLNNRVFLYNNKTIYLK